MNIVFFSSSGRLFSGEKIYAPLSKVPTCPWIFQRYFRYVATERTSNICPLRVNAGRILDIIFESIFETVSTLPHVVPEKSDRGNIRSSLSVNPIFAPRTIFEYLLSVLTRTFVSSDLFAKTISSQMARTLYFSSFSIVSAILLLVKFNTRKSVDWRTSSVLLSILTITILFELSL
jgi:hypothetical protein